MMVIRQVSASLSTIQHEALVRSTLEGDPVTGSTIPRLLWVALQIQISKLIGLTI
jgi:hypothetical protein